MGLITLEEVLKGNSYPGRGIVTGLSEDGRHAVLAYFIMGRSANSRNRIFVEDGDGIRTKAFDESKVEDPSLIIYTPVRILEGMTIVSNGDQTDTIYETMKMGRTFEESLRSRKFEPDAPNYTPRISGLIDVEDGRLSYWLSILKTMDQTDTAVLRFTFSYTDPLVGRGHFIHTYTGDGEVLESFKGEPTAVLLNGNIDQFTENVWNSLDENNKISLFTRFIELENSKYESRIVNKHILKQDP